MQLLDLPAEVVHEILVCAALSRGVVRALRLKLVCKQFYHSLQPALFESRLLDDFRPSDRENEFQEADLWQIRKFHSAAHPMQQYLVYRVRTETDPAVGRYVEMRLLAQELVHQAGADFQETLEGLCWLALDKGVPCPGDRASWRGHGWGKKPDPDVNLLSAAAYFGHIPLATKLLSEGHRPDHEDMFSSPMGLATFAGNTDMLELIYGFLPATFVSLYNPLGNLYWPGEHGRDVVRGAALRGDVNLLRPSFRPTVPPGLAGSDDVAFRQPHIQLRREYRTAAHVTRSPEVFEYIDNLDLVDRPDEFRCRVLAQQPNKRFALERHADLGNVEMVRYLLDKGADVYDKRGCFAPLNLAARACHEDIVDLLLERGANPNHIPRHAQPYNSALAAAAAGGSMVIVRKLIAAGAKPALSDWWPLSHAVRLEHTAMVELFLDMEVGGKESWPQMTRDAETQGLGSMAQLLRQRGGDLT